MPGSSVDRWHEVGDFWGVVNSRKILPCRLECIVGREWNSAQQQTILKKFKRKCFSRIHGCQMFVTRSLKVGIVAGNCNVQVGDELWCLNGALTPMLLRREDGHHLISSCYLPGWMEGDLSVIPEGVKGRIGRIALI
jgi:hypothetical protein